MGVTFSTSTERKLPLKKVRIKNWISSIIKKEKHVEGKIAYTFVTDKELLKINKEFLNHDTYTDIVTFDYGEGKIVNGEIYISSERVKENAERFESDFETELLRVIIHGVLHLCGYGDKSKAEKKLMREKEDKALRLYDKLFS